MTPGIAYALAAMVCFGAADLIYKQAADRGVEARHFVMVQSLFYCPMIATYGLATRSLSISAGALWGALAGLFIFVGLYNFAHSLRTGAVSTNAPIFRLSFTITAALAVLFLGEPVTMLKLVGLALALIAVWCLLGATNDGARPVSGSSLVRVLIATVSVGLANLFYKVGLLAGATTASLLAAQACMFISLATLHVLVTDRALRPPRPAWVYSPIASVLLLGGFVTQLVGLEQGPASVLIPVAQMGFVVTALLGRFLFGEALTPRKRFGLCVAAASLAVLAVS